MSCTCIRSKYLIQWVGLTEEIQNLQHDNGFRDTLNNYRYRQKLFENLINLIVYVALSLVLYCALSQELSSKSTGICCKK